jgi:hypothetical protein
MLIHTLNNKNMTYTNTTTSTTNTNLLLLLIIFNITVTLKNRYWAYSSCPTEQALFDPWSCNFIPLTNCSTRENAIDMPTTIDQNAEGDKYFFTNSLGITDVSRRRIGDMSAVNMDAWLFGRAISFIQRPHARLRQLMRRSMHRIHRLPTPPHTDTHADTHTDTHRDTHIHRDTRTDTTGRDTGIGIGGSSSAYSSSSSTYSSSVYRKMGGSSSSSSSSSSTYSRGYDARLPCVAMHVRHGDAVKLEVWNMYGLVI